MSAFAGPALVAAESILALTPVAIKLTQLDPISQIWSRILSTAVLGYAMADKGDRGLERGEWAGAAALGYANLLHVASSYESFRNLPAGQAMSLLYTYPLWNLVFNNLFGEVAISAREYGLMGVAAIGSIVLNLDPGKAAPTPLGRKASQPWGIFMGLVMALTESVMHVILRNLGWRDPAKSVWVVNGVAAGWLGLFQGLQSLWHGSVDDIGLQSGTWGDAAALTLFHGATMFSGYWLRFYAVPRLSVVTYSILSYAGLLASYLFGMLFLGERPGWMSVLGAVMILVSGILLQLRPQVEAPAVPEKEKAS
jgi:drug/metabolite transporter (DMT)-like permease